MSSDVSTKEQVGQAASTSASPAFLDAMRARLRRGDFGQFPVLLTLVLVMLFFNIASHGVFLRPRNLSNLVLQQAVVGTLALGSVLVLLIGEIDLSIAAVSYLCGAVMVKLSVDSHQSAFISILAALALGVVIGLVNGFFVAYMRVPSFIVTLAGLLAYSGLVLHVLLPNTTIRLQDGALKAIAADYVVFPWDVLIPIPLVGIYVLYLIRTRWARARQGLLLTPWWDFGLRIGAVILAVVIALGVFESYQGVPITAIVLLGLILIFWLIMRFTTFGRHVYAVGGNAEAARRAGINVVGIRIAIFGLASTLAAMAGILEASRIISGSAQIDPTFLLNAIAMAVIGGVSLFGGRGSVWAVVIGMLIIGSLANGLVLLGKGTDIEQMVEGAVLLIAVTVDAVARRRNASGLR
ncbi:MAG TPA: inner-membrane translocator [Ktedonobacterales bacterium]